MCQSQINSTAAAGRARPGGQARTNTKNDITWRVIFVIRYMTDLKLSMRFFRFLIEMLSVILAFCLQSNYIIGQYL